jgi:hypothetical protein
MGMTPEAKVKKKVVKVLKKHGAWYCFAATYGRGRSGIPDILVCHKGAFFGLEIKAGANQPTPLQDRELKGFTAAGGWGIVINEDLVTELDDLLSVVTDMAVRNREHAGKAYKDALNMLENVDTSVDDDAPLPDAINMALHPEGSKHNPVPLGAPEDDSDSDSNTSEG